MKVPSSPASGQNVQLFKIELEFPTSKEVDLSWSAALRIRMDDIQKVATEFWSLKNLYSPRERPLEKSSFEEKSLSYRLSPNDS